nr:S24 family peptidase [uncultured Duganella sp.]
MTREEIRRHNARELARQAGGQSEFGRLLQMDSSQVSQIIGRSPKKNIGNSIARRIEKAFGKNEGWLDREHFGAEPLIRVATHLEQNGWSVKILGGDRSQLPPEFWMPDASFTPDMRVSMAGVVLYVDVWRTESDAPPNLKAFPSLVGFRVDRLDDGLKALNERATGIIEESNDKPAPIRAVHPDDAERDDLVYVPESRIEFSAGNGRTAIYELIEDQEPASYRLSWFQKHRINPNRVRRFRVSGDSMEPLLYARDTILVNEEETTVVDGKLYAIRYGDELRVKYLRKLLDGTLVLHSVNPLYDDEKVSPELAQEHISIIGRVRDRSGTGGL